MEAKELVRAAFEARKRAYAPYSRFRVGAALLTEDGKVYAGCNIETSSFTPTSCAERTAFCKALSEGERRFAAIAVVGGREGEDALGLCPPCGVCRQFMREFCGDDFQILLGSGNFADKEEKIGIESCTLKELLPLSFGRETLE